MNQSTAGRLPARTLTALAVTAALGAFSQPALAQTTNTQATAPAASISASKPSQSNKTSAKKVSTSRSVKLDTVLVTARNRSEAAQNVPLPIRVVGGERLDREDIKSLWDLPSIAPNLQLNNPGENARKVSPGIRGLGRGGANDSMEQSVGTIVDGVTLYYSGQAWADYVDLDRIEVLYGPQGTLVGKNTSLGAIKIATKAPSFKAASRFEVQTGDQNTLQGKFSTTGPLIDDKLAYRGTFLVTRQDGLYENTYQSLGKAKETWREANKVAGRVQFLWTPNADLRGRFIFDKLRSDERVNTGNVLESNGPATFADGTARPLTTPVIANTGFTPKGSYQSFGFLGKFAERAAWFHLADGTVYQPELGTTDIENSEARPQITNQYGGSAQFDWDRDGYSLTSISAYRYQDFDIKNGGQFGPFYISNSGQQLWNDQISQELRITTTPAPGKAWDYQAGLFYLDAEVYSDDPSYYGPDAGAWVATRSQFTTLVANENAPLRAAGRELLRASHDGIYQSSVTDATTKSLAVYGQADWHFTDKANLAFGLRLTDEEKHNKIATELDRPGQDLDQLGAQLGATAAQIAAAKAVRLRSVPIAPFSFVAGKPIDDTLVAWNISPSYKLSPDINLYASVGKGVKAGFIFFQQYVAPTDKGFETAIKAEETLDFELGFKSLLLDRTLQWNANLYNTEVKDYQASWRRNNPDAPGETIAGWGNAPKVLARGIETEVNYRVNAELDLNLAAAYNKATYEAEWLVQKPEILATNQYFDANGQQIANVPKTVINYGLSYVTPWEGFLWRATLQNTFKSSSYFNDNQAAFTRQGSYTVSNLSLGFGSEDKKWELALQVRNLFDKEYSLSRSTYTATAGQTLTIGQPRLFQLNLKYSL